MTETMRRRVARRIYRWLLAPESLDVLTTRQAKVFIGRYGCAYTYTQVALSMGISRSKARHCVTEVRQILEGISARRRAITACKADAKDAEFLAACGIAA